MKHIRLLCASLLMVVCMVSAALIFAADCDETVYAWQRVKFSAFEEVRIYGKDGVLLQTLMPQNGQAVSKLLPEGEYYAVCGTACTEFFLYADRSVEVLSGCGWVEENDLHFSEEPVGCIRIETGQAWGTGEFLLIGEGIEQRKTVNCSDTACQFSALPYGYYKLYCGGAEIAALSLDAQKPNLSLILT